MKTQKSLVQLREERERNEILKTAFASFRRFWEPSSYDERTGASVGGHPDAHRKWVRPDDHASGWYGLDTSSAFKTQCYWAEFIDWKDQGEPASLFTSNALPLTEQQRKGKIFVAEIKALVQKMKAQEALTPRRKGIVRA